MEPRVIEGSRIKVAAMAAVCAVLTLVILRVFLRLHRVVVLERTHGIDWFVLLTLEFVIGAIVLAFALLSAMSVLQAIKPSRLVLDADGFSTENLIGRNQRRSWKEAGPFSISLLGRSRVIVFDIDSSQTAQQRGRKTDSKSKSAQRIFPGSWNMPQERLLAVLNHFRNDALAK